ncbi:hypothetical protein [Mesorhizobium sp. SP-1A]|uniref:hypothetical protein n=1 Tax=Mesorhizobium sp. SP-1A TaxID=3077840 RepID=UPI0028F6D27A|nr:hypothetical protein [Mesorhizobium sp. SP-1A]
MLPDIDPIVLCFGFVAVAAVAFFFGMMMDAVMHEGGFGPTGNAMLFVVGFVGALYIAHLQRMDFEDVKLVAGCGFGGALALFSVVALLKAGLARR